jgi:hypothetical protein
MAGCVLAAGALVATAGAASAATQDQRAAARAAAWLERTPVAAPGGQVADTIVALRAAGRSRASVAPRLRVLARLAPRYATTAGGAAKVTLAAVAAGADPSRLRGRDYVRGITSRYARGRYGATAFDQALSLLALAAARRPVPRTAIRLTLAARGEGGWGFTLSPTARDSVDATGLMIEALRAVGVPARHAELRAAARWMVAQRNTRGGYASGGRGGDTQANPTSNAIRALRALGRPVPAGTRAELRRLQDRSGAVRFTRGRSGSALLATNDALVALTRRTLPVR